MFKKHLLLLYSILISCSLSAQVFNGGINVGLSSSQVGGDNLAWFNKGLLLFLTTPKTDLLYQGI